jgi:hypothetical protein
VLALESLVLVFECVKKEEEVLLLLLVTLLLLLKGQTIFKPAKSKVLLRYVCVSVSV